MTVTTGTIRPAAVAPRRRPRVWMGAIDRISFAATLGVLCSLALAVRLFQLDGQPFWFDEGFTGYHVQLGLTDLLREIVVVDHHPPLHYLLLWAWSLIGGSASEYSLRFVSVVFSVATVALIGRLGERVFGRPTGLVAAGLLAVSPMHVWFGQEARMYAQLAFCVVAALLLLRLAAEHEPGLDRQSRRHSLLLWGGYAGFSLAAFYTHYYGLFLVPIGFALCLASRPRDQSLVSWFFATGAAGLLFLPWVPVVLNQAGDMGGYSPPVAPWTVYGNLFTAWTVGEYPFFDGAAVITVAMVALAIVGVVDWVVRRPYRRGDIVFPVVWVLAPPMLAWLASVVLGIELRATGMMYYLFVLPGFLLLVARGVSAVTLRIAVFAALGAVALMLLAIPALTLQFGGVRKEDFRGAARLVEQRLSQSDAVILNAESIYPAFGYYYGGAVPWQRAEVGDPEETAAWLQRATIGADRAWVVLSHQELSDPNDRVLGWFDANATLLEQRWFDGVRVAAYQLEKRPNMTPPAVRLERKSNFANGLQLQGYELSTFNPQRHYQPVKLYWFNQRQQPSTYRLVTQLVDQRGTVWSQIDRPPIAGGYTTERWQVGEYLTERYDLPLPPGLPPLQYELRLFMYDQRDGRRVPVTAESNQPTSDIVLARLALGQMTGFTSAELAASVERTFNESIGDVGSLIGGTFPSGQLDPGARVELALLWNISRPITATQSFAVRFVEADGSASPDVPLFDAEDVYPPSRWQRGQVIRTNHRITVPSTIKPGDYRMTVVFKDTARPGQDVVRPMSIVSVAEPQRVFTAASLPARIDASFANLVRLASYDLPATRVKRGTSFELGLQWQALAPMRDSYSVFVHVTDSSGRIVAQSDGVPGDRPRATSSWVRDEIVTERRRVALPPDLPSGSYRIAVGLYNPSTGVRLQLARPAGADKANLPQELVVTE